MPGRIDLLLAFIDDDPSDPFNYYALALEYLKTNRQDAIGLLEGLVISHPQYVPTYYQLAGALQETGETAKALQVYERGIKVAQESGDLKTKLELIHARDLLIDHSD